MPTEHDQSLADRYHKEHLQHLEMIANMTPSQIFEMEMKLHNAIAALQAIADPTIIPSHGDPSVLRDYAKQVLSDIQ